MPEEEGGNAHGGATGRAPLGAAGVGEEAGCGGCEGFAVSGGTGGACRVQELGNTGPGRLLMRTVLPRTCREGTSASAGRNISASSCSAAAVRGRSWTRRALKKSPRPMPKKRASGSERKIVVSVVARSAAVLGGPGNESA